MFQHFMFVFTVTDEFVNAWMPTECTETDRIGSHYNMNHKKRGKALIFNHYVFEVDELEPREGTQADAEYLEWILKKLGFDVKVHQDFKYKQIKQHLAAVAKSNHNDSDCLAVFVLSHGNQGKLYARDRKYNPEELWSPFSASLCTTLAGKPKLFFVQACRGVQGMAPVTLNKIQSDGASVKVTSANNYTIPSPADFLIVYSTLLGFKAWRETHHGSWFIQTVCDELKYRAYKYDLLTILTFVSQKVAINFEERKVKQIPCITSTLTRLVQFNVKQENLLDGTAISRTRINKCSPEAPSFCNSLSNSFY